MLFDLIKILFGIVRKSSSIRPFLRIYRLYRIRFSRSLRERPYYVVFIAVPVLILLIFNPSYLPFLPAQMCGFVDLEHDRLYKPDGDRLRYGGDRPCEPQTVQAIEFFNLSNVVLEKDARPISAVTAGIFMAEKFRGVSNKSQWHEYTVFHKANNFIWTPSNPDKDNQIEGIAFDKGECSYSRDINHQDVDFEVREGVIIRSGGVRSDPEQGQKIWSKCNWGSPGQEGFEECKYQALEFFLPVGTPEQKCPKRSILDTWVGRGTDRTLFTEAKSYDFLVRLAQDRWDKQRIAPISEESYKKLTSGLPKLCMRWVPITGGKAKPWEEFATIPVVWCDL